MFDWPRLRGPFLSRSMLLSLDLDIFISSPSFSTPKQPLFDSPYSAKVTRGSHPSNSEQTNAARKPQNRRKLDLDRGIRADIKNALLQHVVMQIWR